MRSKQVGGWVSKSAMQLLHTVVFAVLIDRELPHKVDLKGLRFAEPRNTDLIQDAVLGIIHRLVQEGLERCPNGIGARRFNRHVGAGQG